MNYIIIRLDCQTFEVSVLGHFEDYKEALQFMTSEISSDKMYNDADWYKKQLDENNVISVYKANYFSNKTLISKYFIKSF